jgi:parvulin-like peptidyl-prolyl isomerase
VKQLRDDPDSFAATAEQVSEDYETAQEGGELGWVAPYQLDKLQEDAVFGLTEVDQISDPVDAGADGITIYKLLESSDRREIEDERLDEIRSGGFDRWLDEEVRAPVESWLDPQYASSPASA